MISKLTLLNQVETSTLEFFNPNSFALFPHLQLQFVRHKEWFSWSLKPLWPDDDQAIAIPFSSVIVIIVLLKEDTMCYTRWNFFNFRFLSTILSFVTFSYQLLLLFTFSVLALVWVLWPLTGNFFDA